MITSSDYVSSGKNEDVEIPSQLLLDTQVNDSTKMDTSSGNKETYDSIAVTETHLPTPFELRMLVMGQRFQKLQSESFPLFSPPSVHSEDLDFSRVGLSNPSSTRNLLSSGISTDTDSSVNFSGPRFHKRTAADRWDRVRALVVRQKDSLKDVEKVGMKFENKQVDEEMEGAELEQYWQSSALDLPPPMPKFTPVLDDIEFNELDEDASYHSVLELPPELEAFELPPPPRYEEEFQEASGNVALTVSRVPESVLSKHQEELDNKLMEERRSTADKIRAKEVDILWRENLARERVIKLEKEAQERIAVEKMKYGQYLQHKEAELSNSFRRAREQLEQGVKAQKAAIYQKYGEYEVDQEALSRRAVVSYDNIPQPIEVRVHFLRALKTKLPKGAYVLMLSQFDRLGGRPLRYKNIACYGIGPDKPAVSKIVKHYGRYFDRNLKFEDSVFTLCPPRSALKPSYCLVFELFELESHRNQTGDRVVAWSAIPMCNEHMAVIDGKFKLPFLRGEVTPEIEHFRSMEIAMGHDLNTWLCNGYFEIRHLPRDVSYDMSTDENIIEGGSIKKELGMEYNYLTKQVKTLQYNKHKMEKAEMKKAKQLSGNVSAEDIGAVLSNPSQNSPPSKENAIRKSARSHDAADGNGGSYFDENADQTLKFDDKVNVDGLFQRKNVSIFDRTKSSGQLLTRRTSDLEAGGGANGGSTSVSHKSLDRAKSKKSSWSGWFGSKSGDGNDSDNPGNEAAVNEDDDVEVIERGYDSEDEFYMNDEQKGKLAGIEAVSDPNDKLWAASGLIDNSIIKTNTNRVMVRRNQSDGLRLDTEITSLENATKQLRKVDVVATEKRWEPLTDPREMETYTMAIASDPGARRKLLPTVISKSKLRYLYLESFGDFAPNMVGTFDFYVTVLVMIMSFWLRIYVHYVGQYFFLQAIPTPVFSFKVGLFEMIFKYMSASIGLSYEVGVVAMGPLSNIFVFLVLAGSGMAFYRLAGFMPESGSKFIAAYGIASILDPILVIVVDIIQRNYACQSTYPLTCADDYTSSTCECFNGDFVKLWYRFEREEGSGITGLFITLMIYIATTVISALLFYEYMLHIHKDARILDLWRRIDAPAEEFFLPHDYEISRFELTSLCNKAKLWRGANGATRKLVISDYLERDPYDMTFQEHTKHYAIYQYETMSVVNPITQVSENSVRKTLYRHFLLIPDGSIIEIFDEFDIDVTQHTKALDKLLGHQMKRTHDDASDQLDGNEINNSTKYASNGPIEHQKIKHKKLEIFRGLDRV